MDVPGHGWIRYELAFGGNFFAIVDLADYGIAFDRAEEQRILDAGQATMDAINAAGEPVHVLDDGIRGVHHVQFVAPGSDAEHSRHAMAISPGYFDRSPCGTGTSARMAQPHDSGELALQTDCVNESYVGTHFVGRLGRGCGGRRDPRRHSHHDPSRVDHRDRAVFP